MYILKQGQINMKHNAIAISSLFILLPGCLAPHYRVPNHAMPNAFKNQPLIADAEPPIRWWHQFNDPLLNELISKALEQNYTLRIAIEKIEEARALYQFKRAQLFPEIDVVSQINRTRFSNAIATTSFLTNDRVSFYDLGFDAFWELDFFGRLASAKRAQFYTYQAQIENMRNVYITLLADVARAYIEVCALHKKATLQHEIIRVDEKLLILQKTLFNSGLASDIIVQQSIQELENAKNFLKTLETAMAQTQHQLAVLIGINPEELTIPNTIETVPLSQVEIAIGIPSELLRRRPDIRQAERELAAANELIGHAVAEWFPKFTLFGGLASDSSTGGLWFTNRSLTWYIGPSISWPLINFGRINATIHAKESSKRQAALQYSNTIINALKDVEDFLVAYCNNKEQYAFLKNRFFAAHREFNLTIVRFESGLSDQQETLFAQKNALTAAQSVVDIERSLSSNLVSLYKALGGGWNHV